jgi:hypothetical protein
LSIGGSSAIFLCRNVRYKNSVDQAKSRPLRSFRNKLRLPASALPRLGEKLSNRTIQRLSGTDAYPIQSRWPHGYRFSQNSGVSD